MPVDKSKYPANWSEIRAEILKRAGGKDPDPRIGATCEICGERNYSIGHRDDSGFWIYREMESANQKYVDDINANRPIMMSHRGLKYIQIVLTIMHLDHDTTNNDHSNLKAGCQRCHNRHDVPHRKANRAETHRKKTGQLKLEL